MCKTGKIFCPRCNVFIAKTGDKDNDDYFQFCKNYNTCLREKHKNIEYVHYYFGLCKDCNKTKNLMLQNFFNYPINYKCHYFTHWKKG